MSEKMKNIFNPDDFIRGLSEEVRKINADNANRKINDLIKEWPQVFANWKKGPISSIAPEWRLLEGIPNATHSARLAFIEEIPALCAHEADEINKEIGGFFCKHCGTELVRIWGVKK